jgi:hypothetical protein
MKTQTTQTHQEQTVEDFYKDFPPEVRYLHPNCASREQLEAWIRELNTDLIDIEEEREAMREEFNNATFIECDLGEIEDGSAEFNAGYTHATIATNDPENDPTPRVALIRELRDGRYRYVWLDPDGEMVANGETAEQANTELSKAYADAVWDLRFVDE